MPSIPNRTPARNVILSTLTAVYIKANWGDDWELVPYLTPLRCTEAAAPEIPEATFRYDFGSIKREDKTSFATYTPRDLAGKYIMILIHRAGMDRPAIYWAGVVVDQSLVTDRPSMSGEQIVTALGFAHLLERQYVSGATCFDSRGNIGEIGWTPTFNKRSSRGRPMAGGTTRIEGNRSSARAGPKSNGEYPPYVFSVATNLWTNTEIINYLLYYHTYSGTDSDPAIKFRVGGQTAATDQLEDIHQLEGMTVWQALNKLIDRRRGLGFYVKYPRARVYLATDFLPSKSPKEIFQVWIYTLADRDYPTGSLTFPRNDNQTVFSLPTSHPYTHLVGDVPFRTSAMQFFDEIEVVGPRVQVVGTWSIRDGTLTQAWTAANENAYIAGDPAATTEEAHDQYRANDIFRGVFTTFVAPANWNGTLGDGLGGNFANCSWTMSDDGIDDFTTPSPLIRGYKWFFRDLPFERYTDYKVYPFVRNAPATAEPEFVPFQVFVDDSTNTPYGQRAITNRWSTIDKLNLLHEELHPLTARPMDNIIGYEIHCNPPHYVAASRWPPATAAATLIDPQIDSTTMLVTGMVEIDMRAKIVVHQAERPGPGYYVPNQGDNVAQELTRRLVIDIPEAQVIFAHPQTVVGVTNGTLDRIGQNSNWPGPFFVMDERKRLRWTAWFAAAWYAHERQAVQIPLHQIGRYVDIGVILTGIDVASTMSQVRAPVSAIATDFEQQTVTVETGWASFDAAVVAGAR